MLNAADLPDDIAVLKAMLVASEARNLRKDERIERLEKLVAAFKQAAFGRKSEKSDPAQFELALEDLETAIAAVHAEEEVDAPAAKRSTRPRAVNRGALPKHLPRIEEVIEPESLTCACGGCLHSIGEDVSERLDIVPARFRVIVTRRPKYACRSCTDGVVQAPAPARLIPGGLPTEATVAHVLVSKYADHLPLYRQTQICSRQGIDLDRSTLADWVGRAAFELRPVFDALIAALKRSTKLFMDETRAPVLDPGRCKTKTGYFWALARCKLVEIARTGPAPIAEDGVKRIGDLYRIETEIRGSGPAARNAARQERSAPIVAELESWLTHHRARVASKSPLGEALNYTAKYWGGLCLFLTDGRVELDSNAVERTIRPIALNRKNALFAGHDPGAENWAAIASLIETCKLNAVDPHAWLAKTLKAIVDGHPQNQIADLLPWNYPVNV